MYRRTLNEALSIPTDFPPWFCHQYSIDAGQFRGYQSTPQLSWREAVTLCLRQSGSGRPNHLFGSDFLIKLFLGQKSKRDHCLFKRGSLGVRFLGDFGGVVITNMRIERRH